MWVLTLVPPKRQYWLWVRERFYSPKGRKKSTNNNKYWYVGNIPNYFGLSFVAACEFSAFKILYHIQINDGISGKEKYSTNDALDKYHRQLIDEKTCSFEGVYTNAHKNRDTHNKPQEKLRFVRDEMKRKRKFPVLINCLVLPSFFLFCMYTYLFTFLFSLTLSLSRFFTLLLHFLEPEKEKKNGSLLFIVISIIIYFFFSLSPSIYFRLALAFAPFICFARLLWLHYRIISYRLYRRFTLTSFRGRIIYLFGSMLCSNTVVLLDGPMRVIILRENEEEQENRN